MAVFKGYGDFEGLTRRDFTQEYSTLPIAIIKFVATFPGLTAREISDFFDPHTRHDVPWYDPITKTKKIGQAYPYNLGQELNALVTQGWLRRKKNRGKVNRKVFAYFANPFKVKEIEALQ